MLNAQKTASTVVLSRALRSSHELEAVVTPELKDAPLNPHRRIGPRTVEREAEARLPTEFGEFRIIGYRSLNSTEEFVALARGELRGECPTLVRIHSRCMTGDVFGSVKCDCGRQLHAAMYLIASEERGAIVYQQQEGRGIGIINKIRAYALQDEGADTVEANEMLGLEVDPRRYDQCAEILLDIGLCRVRVMSRREVMLAVVQGLNIAAIVTTLLLVRRSNRVCPHHLKVAETNARGEGG